MEPVPADAPPPADDAPATAGDARTGLRDAAPWAFPFTVRGRLDDTSSLRWRIDPGAGNGAGHGAEPGAATGDSPDDGPVDGSTLRAALAAAADGWDLADGVQFGPADPGEPPDVVVSWQTPASDPCGLFGRDASVAHTGPMGAGAFVHLDASRRWCLDGREGRERLDVALAHEFGHVLGLDHSPEPSALMYPDTRVAAPAPADLAGAHTLYGGGEDAPGDLAVLAADGGRRAAPSLRRLAPHEHTAVALFDTDGDADRELLVWRTDREGAGALLVCHFAPGGHDAGRGPRLVRTVGPLLDLVPWRAITSLRVGPDGRRWIVTREGEDVRVRGFDERGWPRAPDVDERIALDVDALLALPAPEVLAGPPGTPPRAHGTDGARVAALVGDLDGDGHPERVLYAPAAPDPTR